MSWENAGKNVLIQDVKQGILDKGRHFVAAISKNNPKTILKVFSESSAIIFTLSPPQGYFFEYLLSDDSHGVRVICSAKSAQGDILDWYFKIDLSSHTLIKQGRAY